MTSLLPTNRELRRLLIRCFLISQEKTNWKRLLQDILAESNLAWSAISVQHGRGKLAIGRDSVGRYTILGEFPPVSPDRKRSHACLNCPPDGRLLEGIIEMAKLQQIAFDAPVFLAEAGLGRRIVQLKPRQAFFSQGGSADSIFYLQSGRAKLTVVSKKGKEATITLFSVGDFVGEESLATVGGLRLATASAITACTALKIDRE
jgi:hypothetical protein